MDGWDVWDLEDQERGAWIREALPQPASVSFDETRYLDALYQEDMAKGERIAAAFSTWTPPAPSSAVGSWADILTTASNVVSTTAKTAAQILNQKNVLQAQQEETAFNRFLRQAQIGLAKDQLTVGGQLEREKLTLGGSIEKAKLATQLAIAERDARNAAAVPGSFFGIPIPGSSTGGFTMQSLLMIAAVGFGIYFLAKKAK